MDFKYQIENFDSLLKIKAEGTISHMGEYKTAVSNFYNEIKDDQTDKLLIDMTEVLKPNSVLDQLEIANFLNNTANFPRLRKYRVAIITREDHFESYKFFSLYASNIGLVMKIFLNEEDASDWLIKPQKIKHD